MGEIIEPFEFKQCTNILKSTGKKAKNLRELRDVIATVSNECIFHHTYHYFLKGHILEYTSDFAHWAGESLEEKALAEQLSNIDPYDFKNIGDLRKELLKSIDERDMDSRRAILVSVLTGLNIQMPRSRDSRPLTCFLKDMKDSKENSHLFRLPFQRG